MNRVLLVRLGSLGDIVHAIPFAAALRRAFPDARIDWMTDPRYIELLEMVTALDGRIPIDTRDAWRAPGRVLRAMGEVRRTRYDVVFDLQGLLKSAGLARAARVRRVVGFSRESLREPLARFLYTTAVDTGGVSHVIEKNLALLGTVGAPDRRVEFPLEVPRSEMVEAIEARYAPQGFALINAGAAWPNKRWPADRFGAVAAGLRRTRGIVSLVIWGPGEWALAREVVGASGGTADAAPPTSIRELAALARAARVMISGDTGPMHVAGAAGTPLVGLFGPTRPERNGPWAPDDIAISRAADCACVYARRCRRTARCIDDIGAGEVLEAAGRRLDIAASDRGAAGA